MYIKILNNKPENYSVCQLRKDNPNVSFPKEISLEILNQFGVYPVTELEAPSYNSRTHKLVQQEISESPSGWVIGWDIIPLTNEELTRIEENAKTGVRATRDAKLAETDWTQVIDSPFDKAKMEELQAYRQALRDITTQTGFPWTVEWPVKPE